MAYLILILGWIAFSTIHSLMASLHFKKYLQKRVPEQAGYYRVFYNLLATFTFILLLYYQAHIEEARLWAPTLIVTILGGSLTGIGLGIMLVAIRQYDMAEFTGLDAFSNTPTKKSTLQTAGLSGLVRHPLYTGTLLLLWGLWLLDASWSSLVTALCLSLYIRIGIYFEEKKLLLEFGQDYALYQQQVPMLFPRFF